MGNSSGSSGKYDSKGRPEYDYYFKLLTIGSGKSSWIIRYVDDTFDVASPKLDRTAPETLRNKIIDIGNNQKAKVLLQENASSTNTIGDKSTYRGSHAMVFCFDLTSKASLAKIPDWNKQAQEDCSADVVKLLVGMKSDKAPERAVSAEEGQKIAKECGMEYFECSAKTGGDCNAPMDFLLKKLKSLVDA